MNETFVDVLRQCASEAPAFPVFTYLHGSERTELTLTYGELDRRARAVAALLQAEMRPGERALLMYPHGLDYVSAFLGCLYAGVVAVPVYPVSPVQPEQSFERIGAVLADSGAQVILSTDESIEATRPMVGTKTQRWLSTDAIAPGAEHAWSEPVLGPDTLAFLQYTSGLTGTPKGVMLSHSHLIANLKMAEEPLGMTSADVIVSWLPLYHDMGLIGCILGTLLWRCRCILLPPLRTLSRPVRWLEAMSRYKATGSAAPNFGYELAIRKITPAEIASLDLSHWRLAINAAEPVRAETLQRFAEKFAPAGLRRGALRPTYGLAEATVFVSTASDTVIREVDSIALADGAVVHAAARSAGTSRVVGLGHGARQQELRIIDPTTRVPCSPRSVGEVWLAGPHVARGYWNKPELSEATFRAKLASGEGSYLRTGDLGFLDDGELYVVGRIKDLIIIKGRNHAPEDLEHSIEVECLALRPGSVVAFSVDVDREERVVVVAESSASLDPDACASDVRRALLERHGLSVHEFVLVPARTIPRTSSGKVQRFACKRAYLEGKLEVTHRSALPQTREDDLAASAVAPPTSESEGIEALSKELRRAVADALDLPLARIDVHQAIHTLGMDSLKAMDIKFRLEDQFGLSIPAELLATDVTVHQLALQVAKAAAPSAPAPGVAQVSPMAPSPARRSPSEPVVRLFEALARATPGAPAVGTLTTTCSYRELDERANQLARYLKLLGVGAGVAVGIALDPQPETVIGLVATLKAGGTVIPLPREALVSLPEGAVEMAHVLAVEPSGAGWESRMNVTFIRLLTDVLQAQSKAELPAKSTTSVPEPVVRARTGTTLHDAQLARYFEKMDGVFPMHEGRRLVSAWKGDGVAAVCDALWALCRGAELALSSAASGPDPKARARKGVDFSLLYFSSSDDARGKDKYRLLMEGATFADQHGFTAVWVPERHFHPFGGLYPNPTLLAAGLATTTKRIRLRAGSVVLSLHHPVRVAEDWSVVDNLSGGRVDVAFAAGWNARDYVLAPDAYADRSARTLAGIELVRKLWGGEPVSLVDGLGRQADVRIYPTPIQRELPVWLTSARPAETFALAGKIGANVLTAMMAHTSEELQAKIQIYRRASEASHPDRAPGVVTVMLHTFLGPDVDAARQTVRGPFTEYLASSMELWATHDQRAEIAALSAERKEQMLAFAFERYSRRNALFGTVAEAAQVVERLRDSGVGEIASLIDFGVEPETVMGGLARLAELREIFQPKEHPTLPKPPTPREAWSGDAVVHGSRADIAQLLEGFEHRPPDGPICLCEVEGAAGDGAWDSSPALAQTVRILGAATRQGILAAC